MNILQFTDTHLFKDETGRLCGMNTADSLAAVVEAASNPGIGRPTLISPPAICRKTKPTNRTVVF